MLNDIHVRIIINHHAMKKNEHVIKMIWKMKIIT
jgi:hypothetical protein